MNETTDWTGATREALLQTRICDLKLKIEGSRLEPLIARFRAELTAREVGLEPMLYLGDEWFSPSGVVAIAIPFSLVHPRLIELEKEFMFEAEGEDDDYFLRLLRHEAGHCFDHAFGVSRRKKWREIFGSPSEDYHPETYRPRPYSRSFMTNLRNWYAQAHPDEDFAETFAVWLDPASDWRVRYKRWPAALQKLEYVDSLLVDSRRLKGKRYQGEFLISNAARLTSTLDRHYKRRRRENAADYPDFYDGDLKRIFAQSQNVTERKRSGQAVLFMRRHQHVVLESVHRWTGERKYVIENLIRRLKERCKELDLRVEGDEATTLVEVSAYLASLVTTYLFTGKFRRNV